uniref:thiamine biosynthesis protein S n=1 Tax=Timspurckia oligopyrenoides TaxID=708627 RepID=UPI001FCD7BC7|nr:thiamine biosynthesis protein S [Timspurckia oligopyrenoides]UNJ17523.1 thiamine biosynthesis protein S [Timspurckia oligopyrenoides]
MLQKTIGFKDRIKIQLNGKSFSCYRELPVVSLLNYLDFDLDQIIIEYNSTILSRDELDSTTLQAGDRLEIITIVGGGVRYGVLDVQ